jgi:hypothetical protein
MVKLATIASVFRRHPVLVTSLTLTTALALFFAVRFALGVAYWSAHQNEPVQPWMTLGYVGRSYHLDPREIAAIIGLPPPERGHALTVGEIAQQRGVPVADIIRAVEQAIATLKAEQK